MAVYGIEDEELEARQKFLLTRAGAHRDAAAEDGRHRTCAATLLRDAGCVALLRDEVAEGRARLMEAGEELWRCGVAGGAALVALVATEDQARRAVGLWEEVRGRFGGADDEERGARALSATPREVLSLVQAELLVHRWVRDDGGLRERIAGLVSGGPAVTEVGETGLTVGEYAELGLGAMAGDLDRDRVQGWLESVWERRLRDIAVAAEDRYHWRLLVRPSDLVELDSVMLLTIVIAGNGGDRRFGGLRDGPLAALVRSPLTAAEWFSWR